MQDEAVSSWPAHMAKPVTGNRARQAAAKKVLAFMNDLLFE